MFCGLIEKYKSLKSEYLRRSPREKWDLVRNASSYALSFIGLTILEPNFQFWWFSYISAFAGLYTITLFAYTIWYFRSEPLKGLLYTPLLAILIPSLISFSMVMNSKRLESSRSLHLFAGKYIYLDNEHGLNPNYIRACDRSAIKLFKDTTKIISIEVMSFIVLVIFAAYASLRTGEIHFAIPIVFPFTNLESMAGVIINTLSQMFGSYVAVFGVIGIELATCILKNTISTTIATICVSIDELSEAIENPQQIPEGIVSYRFRNIIIQVQDYCRFIQEVSDLYYWKFFIQPFLLALGVSLSLFFYLYGVWESGIGAAVLCYSQLYVLCDIGNEVDLANDKLVLKLLMMPWYLLSHEKKLDYAFVLNRMQNGAKLRMGPLDSLGFETFSNMSKRIYSVLMMLLRVLK